MSAKEVMMEMNEFLALSHLSVNSNPLFLQNLQNNTIQRQKRSRGATQCEGI